MVAMNRAMVFAGIATLFQASGQMIFASLGLMQYFCIIDFLRELPILLYIRVIYFHRPKSCGNSINIGSSIDGMSNQAFVLLQNEPFTAYRTFIINCVSLVLSILWIFSCVGLMRGGATNKESKPIRWPWIIVTVAVCAVDLAATVTYANDTFNTRTLSESMNFIGGTLSGAGNIDLETSWAAWTMVIIYSRLVALFFLNLILVVLVIIFVTEKTEFGNTVVQVEAPAMTARETSNREVEDESVRSEALPTIPRPGLSQSFRRMKARLFNGAMTPSPAVARIEFSADSLDVSPDRSPKSLHVEIDKKRTVNFPKNLLSLPQRLENLIAEQQQRLDKAVIDTSGRHSPPRVSQSLPQLACTTQDARGLMGPTVSSQGSLVNLGVTLYIVGHKDHWQSLMCRSLRRRRGTAAELQGQLPWAYIPASAHRMRDQLPPDEDLPPVPLPDYTAIPSFRKASVHRAASSLSSLTQKKDYRSEIPRPPLTQSDVLY